MITTKFKFPKYGFLLVICAILLGVGIEDGDLPIIFGSIIGALCAVIGWISNQLD